MFPNLEKLHVKQADPDVPDWLYGLCEKDFTKLTSIGITIDFPNMEDFLKIKGNQLKTLHLMCDYTCDLSFIIKYCPNLVELDVAAGDWNTEVSEVDVELLHLKKLQLFCPSRPPVLEKILTKARHLEELQLTFPYDGLEGSILTKPMDSHGFIHLKYLQLEVNFVNSYTIEKLIRAENELKAMQLYLLPSTTLELSLIHI